MSYETKPLGDIGEVDFGRRADVAADHITAHRRTWERSNRRPPSLTAREALLVIQAELHFAFVYLGNQLNGVELTREDFDRFMLCHQRIGTVLEEVIR